MPKKRILIIDDDAAISEFVRMSLEEEPYDVAMALDGKEGLDKAADFRPDLVILDLMMPKMHGYQVCQRLKADERHRGVKVLITSSKSYTADIEHAKEAGADGYLTKPFNHKDLLKLIRELLGDGKAKESTWPAMPGAAVRQLVKQAGESRAAASSKLDIKVRFWGTRGSSPAPGPQTVRYGGNTACTELRIGGQIFIIDCGTGIRELGVSLLEEFKDTPIVGHIFVGHTHWDHIQGFPFFTPLYIPRNQFTIHSVRAAGKSLEKVFRGQMAADYFPVPLRSLSSALQFVEMDGPMQMGPVRVSYVFLNHPGVAIGFRFEAGGKSVTYLSDHETFGRLNGPNDITKRQDEGIIDFCKGSDLLICEAQYTDEEYQLKRGWGHSTFSDAVERAVKAKVKQLAVFHHDPTHTDAMMDGFIEDCRKRLKAAGSQAVCFGAQEGQTVSV